MKPEIDDVYAVLRQWAMDKKPQTYGDLSRDYQARTGHWFEPHGSWDVPLGDLNNRLASSGLPALSALVILQVENEPGGRFWGCAPNVPHRPKNDLQRITEWDRIVKAVIAQNWPHVLP